MPPSGFSSGGSAGFAFAETGYSRAGTVRHPERWAGPSTPLYLPPTGLQHSFELPDHVQRDAMVHRSAPRVPWDEFLHEWFVWNRFDSDGKPSGEHVALIGPTGQGKTTFMHNLYPLHPFTTLLGTKQRDASIDSFVTAGFIELAEWKQLPAMDYPRRVIRPKAPTLGSLVPVQRKVMADAIEHVFAEGSWDLFIDEGYYIDEVLKLSALLRLIYTQIRSAGVSIVLATQRPAWVPVEVYDQSTHLFFWNDGDARNLRRLTELSVRNQKALREIIPHLEMHQVLYMNTRTGVMCRTRCPKIALPTGR